MCNVSVKFTVKLFMLNNHIKKYIFTKYVLVHAIWLYKDHPYKDQY